MAIVEDRGRAGQQPCYDDVPHDPPGGGIEEQAGIGLETHVKAQLGTHGHQCPQGFLIKIF